MELTALKNKITSAFTGSKKELSEILALVEQDKSVFPFNEYEFLICNLIEKKGLTFKKYVDIRSEYIRRNPNLSYFELAGKTFGSIMESYLHGICPELQKPSKDLDPDYNGEYDFWLDGLKIEVKAGRALENSSRKPLVEKALASNTTKNFDIILEQIKPACCDVLVWLVVWRDDIWLWLINAKEVAHLPGYSAKQHRGNTGEGQFHIKPNNIKLLEKYRLKRSSLKAAIKRSLLSKK